VKANKLNGYADLKSFYTSTNSASGSNSAPSTRESGNVAESTKQQELGDSEPRLDPVEAVQGVEEDAKSKVLRFSTPDVHLVSDPGLRVAIDQFHPDIRDDVRRA
jgi:hypothetical protein